MCWPPRLPVAGAYQAATASSVIHTVRLPRLTSAASYSGPFVSPVFCSGDLVAAALIELVGHGSPTEHGPQPYRQGVHLANLQDHNLRHHQYNLWSIRAPPPVDGATLGV